METNSFKKKSNTEEKDSKVETKKTEEVDKNIQNKLSNIEKQVSSKDDEIKALKAKLAEAQKVNKTKKGDIRASVNREGDVKRICIGVDGFGVRLWKKATELTDEDIKNREEYIEKIKAQNAKKYN